MFEFGFLRLSNLTNHVRRHAKLKQFQCVHCNYEHNEIFKVRAFLSFLIVEILGAPVSAVPRKVGNGGLAGAHAHVADARRLRVGADRQEDAGDGEAVGGTVDSE